VNNRDWMPGTIYEDCVLAREQFTGLKDKMAREIFEGDIVEYDVLSTYGARLERPDTQSGSHRGVSSTSIHPTRGLAECGILKCSATSTRTLSCLIRPAYEN